MQKRIALTGGRVGLVGKWAVFFLLFGAIAGGFLVAFGFLSSGNAKLSWLVWTIRGLIIAVFLWSIADAIWTLSIKHLAERCGRWFEKKTIILLVRSFALNGDGC